MPQPPKNQEFIPVNIAVLTVSDTRTEATDTSGKVLVECLTGAGHHLVEKMICIDDMSLVAVALLVDVTKHRQFAH